MVIVVVVIVVMVAALHVGVVGGGSSGGDPYLCWCPVASIGPSWFGFFLLESSCC